MRGPRDDENRAVAEAFLAALADLFLFLAFAPAPAPDADADADADAGGGAGGGRCIGMCMLEEEGGRDGLVTLCIVLAISFESASN